MLLEDKVIEIFCMSNDFYTYFDAMMEKHILKEPKKLNAQCSMFNAYGWKGSFDGKSFFYGNLKSIFEYAKRLRSGRLTLHSQQKTKKLQAKKERLKIQLYV